MDIEETIRNLRKALASGVYEVTIGIQTVKYKSNSEIREALKYYEDQLAKEKYGYVGRTVQAVSGRRFLQ